MPACPSCQHELDEAARSAGRCPACGVAVRQLPQRTIADIRLSGVNTIDEYPAGEVTLELPAGDTAGHSADLETLASLELSRSLPAVDGGSGQSRTVDLG
jgi:hypothetical protein